MEETLRAFVAVDVGPLAGITSLLRGLGATGADLKLVEPENVHLTLKFIGPLPAARVGEVVEAIRAAAAGVAPLTARLEGVGTFGPRGAPRVIWVGLRGAEALGEVARRLDADLALRGVAPKEGRAFKAHVTLARSRSPRGGREVEAFVRANASAFAGDVEVREVRLMRSELGPSGPRYTVVEAVPLGGA